MTRAGSMAGGDHLGQPRRQSHRGEARPAARAAQLDTAATIALLLALCLQLPGAASGYGATEFLRDYNNPKVSHIEVSGDVILTSDLPELHRNLSIVGVGRKRPAIDGGGKYSGIDTVHVLQITNVEMRNFVTKRWRGGAAVLSSGRDNKFDSCVFRNNKALDGGLGSDYGNGGAVYFYDGSWTFRNVKFIGNHADWYGGGLYTLGESSGTLSGCSFENNYSKARGGGVTLRGSFAKIDRCTFVGNKEDGEGGGALSCSKSGCRISNNVFRKNVAKGEGGAIRFFVDDEGGYGYFCKGNKFSLNRATNSSTNNMFVRVTDTAKSFTFCGTVPPSTVVDAPATAIEYGNCTECPK